LCEPLGGTEGLIKAVAFKKTTESICGEEQARMSTRSEFQTEGAAMLKPREPNVVWTRGTDNRLVLEERRERAGV